MNDQRQPHELDRDDALTIIVASLLTIAFVGFVLWAVVEAWPR